MSLESTINTLIEEMRLQRQATERMAAAFETYGAPVAAVRSEAEAPAVEPAAEPASDAPDATRAEPTPPAPVPEPEKSPAPAEEAEPAPFEGDYLKALVALKDEARARGVSLQRIAAAYQDVASRYGVKRPSDVPEEKRGEAFAAIRAALEEAA